MCVQAWTVLKEKLNEFKDQLVKAILGEKNIGVYNSKDPVNLSTGNFIYKKEDIHTKGMPVLSLSRTYNALDESMGSLGKGWRHSYEVYLVIGTEEVKVFLPDGKQEVFSRKKDNTFYSEISRNHLEKEEHGYRYQTFDKNTYYFNEEGECVRFEDTSRSQLIFMHQNGRIKKVFRKSDGAFYEFYYDEDGKLNSVRDRERRYITYKYGMDGALTKASRIQGGYYTYSYDESGYMSSISSGDGTIAVENTFDREGRCINQVFADGGTMSFVYDEEESCVILKERNNSVIRYYHDKWMHNVRTVYEDGEECFAYNRKGYCIYHKNENGEVTHYAYDLHGNITQVIDALGNRLNATYDSLNHLKKLKLNGKEKLHNEYDAKGNLVRSITADGCSRNMTYDENGRLVELMQADGSKINITYDSRGNIIEMKNAFGAVNKYAYDALNRVISSIDGNGNTTQYTYDSSDRILAVINPAGNRREYTYTERGRVSSVTDFDGFSTKVIYNRLNEPELIIDKEGNETRFTYDSMWNISSKTTSDGATTEYIYDHRERLIQVMLPNHGDVTYEYDAVGNRIGVTDAEGNHTSIIYDALNRIIGIIEPGEAKTTYEYDENGNLVNVIDAEGHVYSFTYDEIGRRTSETDPLGNTTKIVYTPLGKVQEVIYPNHSKITYEYEAGGRVKKITQPSGASVSYCYDNNGNVIEEKNNLGQITSYEYDSLNQMISVTSPNGGVRKYEYDAVGHLTKSVDENAHETTYVYSPNGNLSLVKDALGNVTKYSYDCMGHLTRIKRMGEGVTEGQVHKRAMSINQVTTYEWNKSGNIERITDSLGNIETYRYDNNGNIIEKTDKDGYTTAYTYSPMGDITNILYADGKSVTFSYNALRQLEEMKDWLGTTTIKLDKLGRPLAIQDTNGKTVRYEWGCMGEKRKLSYPDGNQMLYTYNKAVQLTSLKQIDRQAEVMYEYDRLGRLVKKQLPNGIHTEYSYNAMGRLEHLSHIGKQGMIEDYQYAYDLAGNKTQVRQERTDYSENNGIYAYEYDAMNRLIQVTKDNEIMRSYAYDSFGNRTRKVEYRGGDKLQTDYCYNVNGQLIREINDKLERTYQYDSRGNLSHVMTGETLLQRFMFDAKNRMSSAVNYAEQNIQKTEYEYNGLGQRIIQNIYQGNSEDSLSSTRKIRYTLDLTRRYHNLLNREETVADKSQDFIWDGNIIGMVENGINSYYMQDGIGSVMALTDQNGVRRQAYSYDEFGIPQGMERQLQPFGFTGYQREETTGLYFAQARQYDAGSGRFVSEDSIRGFAIAPFTLNHYGYCWNRPLDLVDLDGLWPSFIENAVKVVSVAATVVAVGAVIVGTGGTAAVAAAGILTAGTVGGFANEHAGGSYINGFVGGAATGGIQMGVSSKIPLIGNTVGGAVGSGVGTAITEWLDNEDPTVNNKHEDIPGDATKSALTGALWGAFCDGVNGIVEGNNAMLKKDPSWTKFNGYTEKMGNILNIFYGTVTAALANEESFETESNGNNYDWGKN